MRYREIPDLTGFGPYPFAIRGTDTDDQDRLHLFALFSCMQESAYLNFDAANNGQAFFDSNGYCWLLTRISVELDRPLPRWREILTVDTWQQGPRRLVFVRNFRFFNERGDVLGTASSEWVIARQGSHRPLRPDHVWPDGCFGDRLGETVPIECPRLAPPQQLADRPILVKYADFSDIDRNHHVNNTRYVAWCIDAVHAAIGPAADSGLIRRFDINYVSEIRMGAKVNLFCQPGDEPGTWQVEAQRAQDGSRVFQARAIIGHFPE